MNNIQIISDGNELSFKGNKVVNKVSYMVYEYVKSKTKMGMPLLVTKEQLDKMVKEKIIKEI